jgi:hypothetical protein
MSFAKDLFQLRKQKKKKRKEEINIEMDPGNPSAQ